MIVALVLIAAPPCFLPGSVVLGVRVVVGEDS